MIKTLLISLVISMILIPIFENISKTDNPTGFTITQENQTVVENSDSHISSNTVQEEYNQNMIEPAKNITSNEKKKDDKPLGGGGSSTPPSSGAGTLSGSPCPRNITSCGCDLDSQVTYRLNNSINTTNGTCLTITSDSSLLDCQNFTITGGGDTASIGVNLKNIVNVVKFCKITNFDYGINYDTGKQDSVIRDNVIYGNKRGIRIVGDINCKRNDIYRNKIFNNSVYGVVISACGYDVTIDNKNKIYNNVFYNNTKNAYDDSNNSWNTGYGCGGGNIIGGNCTGGNSWNNYTGVDVYSGPYQNESGSDGIGDTPFTYINGGSGATDYFPLVDKPPQWNVSNISQRCYEIESWAIMSNLQTNNLSARALDDIALDWAWLATSENGTGQTGIWQNKTYIYMNHSTVWTWSNFTWQNMSFKGVVNWRIYYNDTSGRENVTSVWSFEVVDRPPCPANITECCIMNEVPFGGDHHLVNDINVTFDDLEKHGSCIISTTRSGDIVCDHAITGPNFGVPYYWSNWTGTGINVTFGKYGRSDTLVIKNCTISGFRAGIYIHTNDSVVWRSLLHDNVYGVQMDYGIRNSMRENIFYHNWIGLRLLPWPLINNRTYVFDNYFNDNNYSSGFDDQGTIHKSYYNRSWYDNKSSFYEAGNNIIDGPIKGGNYWGFCNKTDSGPTCNGIGLYNGTDIYSGQYQNESGSDGLGDKIFIVDGCGALCKYIDYYPLVDNISPRYYNIEGPPDSTYSTSTVYTFNIIWKDNTKINETETAFELDNVNYTPENIGEYLGFKPNITLGPSVNTQKVEHRIDYIINFTGLSIGTHYYKWYTCDRMWANISGVLMNKNCNSTDLLNFTINPIPASCSLTGLTNHTYGSSDTPVCSCSGDGTTKLYRNEIDKTAWNNTAITQEAGDFTWICNTTGYNYTSASITVIQNITKATPTCTLTSSSDWNYNYPTATTLTCSCTGDGTTNLYFNGVLHNDYNNTAKVFVANPTGHSVICNKTEGTNYSSASTSNTLIINKTTPSISVAPLTAVTYPTSTQTGCQRVTGDSGATLTLYRNGSQVATGTTITINETSITLAAGTYNYTCSYTASENYSAFSSVNNYRTVNKATPTGYQSANPAWSVIYSTQTIVSCSLSNGDPGTILTLKRDAAIVNTGTSPSETITLGYKASDYSYTCEYPATQNYSVATLDTDSLTVNKGVLTGSISGSDVTYPASVNIVPSESNTGDSDTVYYFYRDNTLVSQSTGSAPAADTTQLGAGTYNYKLNATGGTNYTTNTSIATKSITVSKATPSGSLTVSPSWTVTYPTQVTIGYSESNNGDNDLIYKVYRDNVDKGSGETWTPNAGTYQYKLNTTGGQNYTAVASMDAKTLTVNRTSSSCSLTSSAGWTYTYPTATTLTCTCTGDGTTNLYFAGVLHNDYNNTSIVYPAHPAGYSVVVCNITQGTNYNNTSTSNILNINKGTLSLSITDGGTWTYPYQTTVTGTESNQGDADVTYKLWRNTVMVDNTDPWSEAVTLGAGSYVYRFNSTGGYNWTANASGVTTSVTIQQNTTNPVDVYFINSTGTYKNQNMTITYGTQTTANATLVYFDSGTANLYEDGSSVSNPRTIILSAGTHIYKGNVTGNANYSSNSTGRTYYIIVGTVSSYCTLTSSSGWNYNYPTSTTLQCSCVGGGTTNLYFNEILHNDYNNTAKVFAAKPSGYSVICNITAGGGYESATTSGNLVINKATSTASLFLSPLSPINYGTTTIESCTDTNPEASSKLYRNGIEVTPSSLVLGAGSYNYVCNVTSTENYTSASTSTTYIVNKASRTCTLATDKGWTRAYDGTPSSTTCTVSSAPSDGSMTFTMNSSSVSSPDSRTNAGIYNYACQWTVGTNYSTCSQQTNTLTITTGDATPPTITIISPVNNTYFSDSVSLKFKINEPTSWIGYSLDNQENVTITGNTTLNSLTSDSHNIIIYANDTSGNMGKTKQVYFTVSTSNKTLQQCYNIGYECMIPKNMSICALNYNDPNCVGTMCGHCMMGSMGCSIGCKSEGFSGGYCILADFWWGAVPGCSERDCCCVCFDIK